MRRTPTDLQRWRRTSPPPFFVVWMQRSDRVCRTANANGEAGPKAKRMRGARATWMSRINPGICFQSIPGFRRCAPASGLRGFEQPCVVEYARERRALAGLAFDPQLGVVQVQHVLDDG